MTKQTFLLVNTIVNYHSSIWVVQVRDDNPHTSAVQVLPGKGLGIILYTVKVQISVKIMKNAKRKQFG